MQGHGKTEKALCFVPDIPFYNWDNPMFIYLPRFLYSFSMPSNVNHMVDTWFKIFIFSVYLAIEIIRMRPTSTVSSVRNSLLLLFEFLFHCCALFFSDSSLNCCVSLWIKDFIESVISLKKVWGKENNLQMLL